MPVENGGEQNVAKRCRRALRIHAAPVLCFVAGLFAADAALAQTKIEQMIVTAQKRAQDIQAVPASISAFTGAGLEERQIKTFADLSLATPNVNISTVYATPQISIRGVSADGYSPTQEPAVAIHIDGVFQPRAIGLNVVMADLESVEVLRGPQGTVYGRNANAGVINLISAKPTEDFEASATIFGGSWNRYGARGYVSGPVTDRISLRLSGIVDRNDGYGENLTTGNDIGGDYLYGGRLSVRLKPIEDVTIDLAATYTYDHNTVMGYATLAPSGPLYDSVIATDRGRSGAYTLEPYKTYAAFDPEQLNTTSAVTGIINWDIAPNVSLKSTTGWQKVQLRTHIIIDNVYFAPGGFAPFFASGQHGLDSHTWSQEFTLNAKIWERIDAVAGLYYMDDVLHGDPDGNYLPGGIPYGTFPWYIRSGLPLQKSTSKAAFLDLTLSITDDLRLLGGIRRTLDHKETQQHFAYSTTPTDAGLFAGCPVSRVPDLDWHSTTGKIGLQYDFTPDIMGYVQWQNGFKTGGWNPGACFDDYQPEDIKSWEVGVKSTLFDGSVTLNAALFDYKYANMQLSRTIGGTSPTSLVDNAASAKIRGAEVELEAYVTDSLRANFAAGYVDSEYGSLHAVNPSVGNPAIVDLTGNQLPRAPKLTISAGLEYTMRIGDFGELKSRGEYSYASTTYFTPFQEAIAKQDGFSIWNAIFTFTPDSCPNLQFQAYVRNLTDKVYKTGGQASGFFQHVYSYYGPPRTFGAEATMKF